LALVTGAAVFAMGLNAAPAGAEIPNANGIGLTPVLGWSSWSSIAHGDTAPAMEAEARAMVTDGLTSAGYDYINTDDFWYVCNGSAGNGATGTGSNGPEVNQWGLWYANSNFPSQGTMPGMEVVANYVHSLGLKFGIYNTPGISYNAVLANTPVEATDQATGQDLGTSSAYTADEIVQEPLYNQENYNCGNGSAGTTPVDDAELNYSSPGAQEYVDSIVNEYGSWGVDFIKFDGIYPQYNADMQAWRTAIDQYAASPGGHKINLDMTEGDLPFGVQSTTYLPEYGDQWETTSDVESSAGSTTAVTNYSNISARFLTVAEWAPYAGIGNGTTAGIGQGSNVQGFNDLDSLEIGVNSGLSVPAEETALALWTIDSSPLIIGTDLRYDIDPFDASLLKNPAILEVDQDSIDAQRIVPPLPSTCTPAATTTCAVPSGTTSQVFGKWEPATGDAIVALFNTSTSATQALSVTASQIGSVIALPASSDYTVQNLITGTTTESSGLFGASVPPEGVAYFKITPVTNPNLAAPLTSLSLSGLAGPLVAGKTYTATESFTNDGPAAESVGFSLPAPSGWTVTPISATSAVGSGQTATATFSVVAPSSAIGTSPTLTGTASYSWLDGTAWQSQSDTTSVTPSVVGSGAAGVVINEVQVQTTSPSQQFVELFNPGSSSVDISGWTLKHDTSSRSTSAVVLATVPASTSLPAGGFYLFGNTAYAGAGTVNQRFTTALSATQDSVAIVNSSGTTVDGVGWGSSVRYFAEGCNAPIAPATAAPGESIVRLPDGQTTGSNCNDFTVTAAPSPGSTNVNEPVLTVTASSGSMNFGGTVPAITPSYSLSPSGSFTLTTSPTCTTTATSSSAPGTYPTSCSGAVDPSIVIDSASYVSGTITIKPVFASGAATTDVVGFPKTFTVTTENYSSPALSESGALPSGVTFTDNGNGTASLSGTPASGSAGTYPLLIEVSNGTSPPLYQSFTLTLLNVAANPSIGDVSGLVTDASSGNPLPNICVYLYAVGGSSASAATCSLTGGSWEFSGLPAGSYDVAFTDPSGMHATQWYTGTSGGSATQAGATAVTLVGGQAIGGVNAAMSLVGWGDVTGTVTNSTSTDLANICVYLVASGLTGNQLTPSYLSATGGWNDITAATAGTCTIANGTYSFYGVPAGSYYVAFADPSGTYATQWYTGSAGGAPSQVLGAPITVPSGEQTVSGINATMSTLGPDSVSGVVTDTSANDLANICVYAYAVGASSATAGSCTIANGTYVIAGLTPGSYDVAFADTNATGVYSTQWYTGSSGGAATQSGAVPVTVPVSGGGVGGVNAAMSLVPYGNVSGVVTDTSANDLANICAYVYTVGGSSPVASSCTLANGTYEFYGLTAGTQYDVSFFDPAYVYTTQWYNGAATQAGATAVTVPAGGHTLSGVNAVMAG
jgi:hypothetical protein